MRRVAALRAPHRPPQHGKSRSRGAADPVDAPPLASKRAHRAPTLRTLRPKKKLPNNKGTVWSPTTAGNPAAPPLPCRSQKAVRVGVGARSHLSPRTPVQESGRRRIIDNRASKKIGIRSSGTGFIGGPPSTHIGNRTPSLGRKRRSLSTINKKQWMHELIKQLCYKNERDFPSDAPSPSFPSFPLNLWLRAPVCP